MKPKHVRSQAPREKLVVVIERLEKTFGKKDAAVTTCWSGGHCNPPN